MKEDPGRGFRRVVPSPKPLEIINNKAIKTLLDNNFTVIATGGGGIPAYVDTNGWYEGLDGVIDKDLASAVMGKNIGADILMILTAVDKVAINFRKENQQDLDHITVDQAKKYLEEGQFPKGSMGPKIQAAINFIENGGEKVIITSIEKSADAMDKNVGTILTR